jgi:mono/diheme cytochrome c family protein
MRGLNVMNTSSRNVALIWTVPMLFGTVLAAGIAWPRATESTATLDKAATGPVQKWARVSVELPTSQTLFPPGNGADIANGECLICHSAGMVLRQPPLTKEEWIGEINKMRNAFGAPLPADQVEALATYLHTINGGQSQRASSAVDGRGG